MTSCCFNPRTRKGCDVVGQFQAAVVTVSIHAPARGATRSRMRPRCSRACFNPRTRKGCDPTSLARNIGGWQFQSTHPQGVRHTQVVEKTVAKMFQSTHPQGVRLHLLGYHFRIWVVSIHAPARGATKRTIRSRGSLKFQSTHPQGVRLVRECLSIAEDYVSIHAPARGATSQTRLNSSDDKFQSTHPQGVRLTWWSAVRDAACFNPRTRKGCDPCSEDLPCT